MAKSRKRLMPKNVDELIDALGSRQFPPQSGERWVDRVQRRSAGIAELAAIAGVGITTVYNWSSIGLIPPRLRAAIEDEAARRAIRVPRDLFAERRRAA